MVNPQQAAELAGYGVVASMLPHWTPPGAAPTRCTRAGSGGRGTTQPVRRFAQRCHLGLGYTPVTPVDPWGAVRAAVYHRTEGFGISPRAAFVAHTRGGWRAAGVDDGLTGMLVPGAPATYAVWDVDELVVAAPDSRVQRWSTDPRSGVPPLPDLAPGTRLPRCLRTVLRGQTIYLREPEDDDLVG